MLSSYAMFISRRDKIIFPIHFNISCLTLVRVLETVALPLSRSTLKLSSNTTLYVTHRHGIGLKQVYKTPLGHFADSNFFSKE